MAKYLDEAGMQFIVDKTKESLGEKVDLAGATMTGELKTPSVELGTNAKGVSTNILEIGNGADASNLANAFEIDNAGNVTAAGDIRIGDGTTLAEANARMGSGYVAKGSILFTSLPTPSSANVGFVYDVYAMTADATPVETDFTIDNRFVDYVAGVTKTYPSHTNVAIVEFTPADDSDPENPIAATYKFDILPGFFDQNIVSDYMEGLSSDDIDDMWNDTP